MAAPLSLRIRNVTVRGRTCHTRLPFRFGIATLERATLALVRVEIEHGGNRAHGYASDLLVPKWFEKDPDKTLDEDRQALLQSIDDAARVALELGQQVSIFELWRRLEQIRVGEATPTDRGALVRGLGVSLVERAALDALCTLVRAPFAVALSSGLLGWRPELVAPELEGWQPATELEPPLRAIELRHTVGLVDTLREREVATATRADDHPLSLEEDIERYQLRWFKVKVGGAADEDRARLVEIAAVLHSSCPSGYRLTLDGNEQYQSLVHLTSLLESTGQDRYGAELVQRIQYIEQPLPRARSFDREILRDLPQLDAFGGVILDEADYGPDAFPRAIELGYRGISVKNCKGVFRALLHRAWCDRSAGPSRHHLLQSSEDLTNLPTVALQQDLVTAAVLGLGHSERNGHHYFAGLDHLPDCEVEAALALHPELYEAKARGARLRIRGGSLEVGALLDEGYGSLSELDEQAWPLLSAHGAPREAT